MGSLISAQSMKRLVSYQTGIPVPPDADMRTLPLSPMAGGEKSKSHKSPSIQVNLRGQRPLYQQLALRDEEEEKLTLEAKKRKLEEIRALHKPIERKDMVDHAIKYERIRLEKEMNIKRKRQAEIKAEKQQLGPNVPTHLLRNTE